MSGRASTAIAAAWLAAAVAACSSAPIAAPHPSAITVPVAVAAAPTAEPVPTAPEPPKVPPGYIEMTVVGLEPNASGSAVLLGDEAHERLIRIFVGGTEAMSIELRKSRQAFRRPLTHDLLDAMMKELGGELVKVQVDDLRDGTFIGSVFVRRDKRVIKLDARPSDAIALALGSEVPIFVAKKVVDEAGVRSGDPAALPGP